MIVGRNGAQYSQRGYWVWRGFEWLRTDTLTRSLNLSGASGSGKSLGVGKDLLPRLFLLKEKVGGPILDPTGSLSDYFFDWLLQYTDGMPVSEWEKYWRRVRYVDMACRDGYVAAWPFYYRWDEQQGLYQTASKFPEIIKRIDPHLMSSSIEGFNALKKIGINAGMILAALDFQITEAEDLLRNSKTPRWKQLFAEAVERCSEAEPAVDFFKEKYNQMKADVQERRTGSFMNKIDFLKDPVQRALYGASQRGIDWPETEDQGIFDFIDYRHVPSGLRMWALMGVFQDWLDYIKWRGPGRHKPCLLVIDELTQMTMHDSQAGLVFADDLSELINVISRGYSVWGVYMYQGLWQMGQNQKMKDTLLACANHALGVCTDIHSALALAEEFYPYQACEYKWTEPVFAGSPPTEIHRRKVPFSVPEWYHHMSQHFTRLGRFRFLVRPARAEGDITGMLQPMSLEHLVGRWVNQERVAHVRQLLAARDGVPISEILAEIEQRQAAIQNGQTLSGENQPIQKRMKSPRQSAKLADNDQSSEPDYLPAAAEDYAGLEDLRS
jgi:hypothetical protein